MAAPDGEDDRALRLDTLSGALMAQRKPTVEPPQRQGGDPSNDGFGSAMSLGLRAGSEFVAAIVVGGLIGWGLDRLAGTKPLFLIAFFLLGVVAGVWNVIRATSPLSRAKTPVKDETKAPSGGDLGGG